MKPRTSMSYAVAPVLGTGIVMSSSILTATKNGRYIPIVLIAGILIFIGFLIQQWYSRKE